MAAAAAPSALVVGPPQMAATVAALLPSVTVSVVPSVDALWRGIAAAKFDPEPAVVVLSQPQGASADALATALAFVAPHTPTVLVHPRSRLEDLGERYQRVVASHPGVCDLDAPVEVVHEEPPTRARLAAALRDALPASVPVAACAAHLAGPFIFDASVTSPPTVAKAAKGELRPADAVRRGRVVAVASAKGGAGKSTTAIALAATVAAAGKRACLVDLDLGDGQLSTLLDVATPSIASLARESAGITDATVLAHLARSSRLGVDALLAPSRGDGPDVRDPMLHRHILTVLRRHFDVIVLDCPVTYRDPLLANVAFVEADRVVALSTLAVTSLAGLRRMLNALTLSPSAGGLGVPRRKFGVVVNGALNGVAVDRGLVEEHAVGVPVVAVVPHAPRDALIATNTRRLDRLVAHPDLAPAYRDLAAWCMASAVADGRLPSRRRNVLRHRVE